MTKFAPGSGVIISWKCSPAIANRIELLGRMNDRRKEYAENRNIEGMRQLASEYAARNMLRTANNIYIEIARMEKR